MKRKIDNLSQVQKDKDKSLCVIEIMSCLDEKINFRFDESWRDGEQNKNHIVLKIKQMNLSKKLLD